MKSLSTLFGKLLTVVGLAGVLTASAADYSLTSSSYTYYKGGSSDDFVVTVTVQNKAAAGYYDFRLYFDKTVVQLKSREFVEVVDQGNASAGFSSVSQSNKNGYVNFNYEVDAAAESLPAGTNAVIAKLTFSHVLDAGVPVAESLATGKAFDFTVAPINAWRGSDDQTDIAATTDIACTAGAFNVVKAFNAADLTFTQNDWDGSAVTVAASNFSYTDDKGAATAGAVTAIGEVTCSITGIDFGSFAVANGGIKWNPAAGTKAAIGHQNAVFTVPFSATGDKGGDDATLTLTVKPANALPVFAGATIDKNTEGDVLQITLSATDADGDAVSFTNGSYTINGAANAGAFVDNVWTSSAAISFDAVAHPNKNAVATFSCTMTDGIAEVPVTVDVTIIDQDRLPDASLFTAAILSITPDPVKADDIRTHTMTYSLEGAPEYDLDGDKIIYYDFWNGNGITTPKRGNKVELDLCVSTVPYQDGKYTVRIAAKPTLTATIANTAPEITSELPSNIFIQKGEQTSASIDFVVYDADDDETSTILVSTNEKADIVTSANSISYQVKTAYQGEDFEDVIKFKVSDGTDETKIYEIPVLYCENPLPVISDIVFSTDDIPEVDADGNPFTFTATLKATDVQVGTIPPAVGDLTVVVPEGLTAVVTKSEGTASEKTFEVTFTTAGYNTITGADRPASKPFGITFKVQDTESGSFAEENSTIDINDVDQAPTAPTAINLSKAELVAGDTLDADAAGAQDADGDSISYAYTFTITYGEEVLTESIVLDSGETAEWPAAFRGLLKDDVVTVSVIAQSKAPYATDPTDSEPLAESITVGNTAPTIALVDAGAEVDEYVADVTEQVYTYAVDQLVTADDADEDHDELSFTVDGEGLADIATVAINEDGDIELTLTENVNTAFSEQDYFFTVTATDTDGATATIEVPVVILPVDVAPTFEIPDTYVTELTGDTYTTAEITIDLGPNDEAANQTIDEADVDVYTDSTVVTFTDKAISYVGEDADRKAVLTLSFTLNATELGGDPIEYSVQVKDSGSDVLPSENTSEIMTGRIILSSTPWYPLVSGGELEDPTDILVEIRNALDGSLTSFVIYYDDEISITPYDYITVGNKGFAPGSELTYSFYNWTAAEGKGEKLAEDLQISVSNYELPGTPSGNWDDAKATFTVSAPLAASYKLVISGQTSLTISKAFQPDEDGLVSSIDELQLQLDAGEYTYTLQGFNPKGAGEIYEGTFTVAAATEEVEWPSDFYKFQPFGDLPLVIGNKKSDITFSWEVCATAKNYVFNLYDGNNSLITSVTTVDANTTVKGLAAGSYRWTVTANLLNGESITTDVLVLTLASQTSGILVLEGWKEPDGVCFYADNLPDGESNWDIVYCTADGNWYHDFLSTEADGGYFSFDNDTVPAGDFTYVMIRPYGSTGEFTTLLLMSYYLF